MCHCLTCQDPQRPPEPDCCIPCDRRILERELQERMMSKDLWPKVPLKHGG